MLEEMEGRAGWFVIRVQSAAAGQGEAGKAGQQQGNGRWSWDRGEKNWS